MATLYVTLNMTNDDEFEAAKRRERERFKQAVGEETDATMLILRAHLHSENMLERILISKLPRADRLIENASLTYAQKLTLVDALDCVPDSIISSLRSLNRLRNQCAHELDKTITDADITKLASPLGKDFTRMKREANHELPDLLRRIIQYVCGHIAGTCYILEHPSEKPSKDK